MKTIVLNMFNKALILSKYKRLCMTHQLFEINTKLISSYVRITNIFNLNIPNVVFQGLGQYSLSTSVNLPNYSFPQVRRTKYTRKRSEYDSDSDDSGDEFKDDASSKVITVKLNSLRADLVIKSGLGMARNKVEEAFYESNIRVNGKKILKKSEKLNIDDEIDLIKGISPMNSNFLNISRLLILSVKERDDDEDGLSVKLRRFKSLYVEDYEDHPWKKNENIN